MLDHTRPGAANALLISAGIALVSCLSMDATASSGRGSAVAADSDALQARMPAEAAGRERRPERGATACTDGFAGAYPCLNVDLMAFLPTDAMGGTGTLDGNDLWGWTDPESGREWALMGLFNGTAFVDVTDPETPVFVAFLPTHTTDSVWRDMKTFGNHAFVVSEANGHGVQVYDLTQLAEIGNPPLTVTADAVFTDIGTGNAHNIVINEESGFAYVVGTSGTRGCSGGMVVLDVNNPSSPTRAGCIFEDGYTHDAQCVNYRGPDPDYKGREICANANEDTLTLFDVTDKSSPEMIAREGYPDVGYTHQGWFTEDHQYFVLGDEEDEVIFGRNTRTFIWDLTDLDNPTVIGVFEAATPVIDHNQYIHQGLVYQANYHAGLRILDASEIAQGTLTEVGYFDVLPANDAVDYYGAWSVYPFFASSTIIVSDATGLFVLRPSDGLSDSDGDTWLDVNDNCTAAVNPDQRDTDGDGIGNICDPDVAAPNDCAVNFADLNVYKANFFAAGDLDTDNDGDGFTNFADLNIVKAFFFGPPGPSATGCN